MGGRRDGEAGADGGRGSDEGQVGGAAVDLGRVVGDERHGGGPDDPQRRGEHGVIRAIYDTCGISAIRVTRDIRAPLPATRWGGYGTTHRTSRGRR
jgi:hypothetical protein